MPSQSRCETRAASPDHGVAVLDKEAPAETGLETGLETGMETDEEPAETLTLPSSGAVSAVKPVHPSGMRATSSVLAMDDDDDDDDLPDVVLSTPFGKPRQAAARGRDSDDDELPSTGLEVSLHSQLSLPAFQPDEDLADDDSQSQVSIKDELQSLSFDALRKEAGGYGLKTRGVGRSQLIQELVGIRVQASQPQTQAQIQAETQAQTQAESEVEDSLDESTPDRDAALLAAIQAEPALHERVLMLEPIPVAELLQLCDQHAIPFKALELQEFCDMHTITWTAGGRTRKRRLKKALKAKTK